MKIERRRPPESLPELAAQIRDLRARAQQDRAAYTQELAIAFAKARNLHKSDQEFSKWITDEKLTFVGRNERAALIRIGQWPDQAQVRQLLEKSKLKNCRTFLDRELDPKPPESQDVKPKKKTVPIAHFYLEGDIRRAGYEQAFSHLSPEHQEHANAYVRSPVLQEFYQAQLLPHHREAAANRETAKLEAAKLNGTLHLAQAAE